mmetsp:Transcript_16529/g.45318  ORF Transcript_16529/g.45318 Transcript_16529/m.45318 type:complete len:229 (-) Transcript_16529:241-927(-)
MVLVVLLVLVVVVVVLLQMVARTCWRWRGQCREREKKCWPHCCWPLLPCLHSGCSSCCPGCCFHPLQPSPRCCCCCHCCWVVPCSLLQQQSRLEVVDQLQPVAAAAGRSCPRLQLLMPSVLPQCLHRCPPQVELGAGGQVGRAWWPPGARSVPAPAPACPGCLERRPPPPGWWAGMRAASSLHSWQPQPGLSVRTLPVLPLRPVVLQAHPLLGMTFALASCLPQQTSC